MLVATRKCATKEGNLRYFNIQFQRHPARRWRKRTGPGNPRALLLIFSLLVVFATLSNAELYVIAHFPYGGGWASRILLTNSGNQDVTAELTYFSQNGHPTTVPLDGLAAVGNQQLRI